MDYKISQEDLFAWCSIPREELANQKNLKMK